MENRIIKFRMWSGKNMLYDIGNVYECLKQQKSHDEGQTIMTSQVGVIPYDHCADGSVFMQFTGLHDKNEVEIYEGDLIKSKFIHGKPLEVIYDNNTAGFKLCQNEYYMGFLGDRKENELEVIGNIYQSPELISK